MSVDEDVNLDEVVDRILPIMNDVASVDTPIRIVRGGWIWACSTRTGPPRWSWWSRELVQNAIEHAFDASTPQGCVTIRSERSARWLDVVVQDDGRGLPRGVSAWRSRIGWDCRSCGRWWRRKLDGSLGMHDSSTGGTEVVLRGAHRQANEAAAIAPIRLLRADLWPRYSTGAIDRKSGEC